jgi:hypothetical protein
MEMVKEFNLWWDNSIMINDNELMSGRHEIMIMDMVNW